MRKIPGISGLEEEQPASRRAVNYVLDGGLDTCFFLDSQRRMIAIAISIIKTW